MLFNHFLTCSETKNWFIQTHISTYPTYPDPTDTYVGRICFKSAFKKNYRVIYIYLNDSVSTSHVVTKWNSSVDNIVWKKVWTLPNKNIFINKVKGISFKIIHQ